MWEKKEEDNGLIIFKFFGIVSNWKKICEKIIKKIK